ncbi:MAG: peptidylprolyl isomerase [Acidimicrobiales bacterium]
MPSDKRARQRAARQQKQAVIQKVKKRRRNLRRGLSLVILAAAVVLIVVLISGTSPKKTSAKNTSTTTTSTTTTSTTFAPPSTLPLSTVAVAPTCPTPTETKRVVLFTKAPPNCIANTSVWNATFDTSVGSFVVQMNASASYAAVNNFVFLARWNYYNGTFFHRVIQDFMDQGGDPSGLGSGGPHGYPGYSFTGNTPPKSCTAANDCYPTGSIALANSGAPSSDGSQFFIIVPGGGAQLNSNPVYTVFGHVTSGLSVVEAINAYGAPASAGETGTPKVKVYLLKVTVTQTNG